MLEKEVIQSFVNIQNAVIATGGGSVLDADSVVHLKNLGKLIYLKTAKNVIKERMFVERLPVFLDPETPEDSFEQMYQHREKIYTNIADLTINTEAKNNEQIVREIVTILEVYNGK